MSFRRTDGVYTSALGEVSIPEADLVSFVLHNQTAPCIMSDARLKSTALIDADSAVSLTYSQLIRDSISFAKTLTTVCKPGEVLFLISANNLHTPTVIFGAMRAGLAVSPCNPNYVLDEIVHQLKDSNSTAIVTGLQCAAVVVQAAAKVGISQDRIFVMPTSEELKKAATLTINVPKVGQLKTVLGAIEAGKKSSARVQEGWLDNKPGETADRIGLLCYSSGTTGRAKGVMLTHRNLVASLTQVNVLDGATDYKESYTRTAGLVPFYHIFGISAVLLRTTLYGGSIVVFPSYQLEHFLSNVAKYGCTFIHVVPPQLLQLAKDPVVSKYDLSKIEMLFCTAAPYSWETVREVQQKLGRAVPVKNAFGCTECSPVATQGSTPGFTFQGRTWTTPHGSCGMMMPSTLIRLVDPETGKDAADGKEGEIWIKGPQVCKGYLNNPQANAETWVDGWMKTGDIAMFDKEGFLFITDRLKELIKTNGFQVSPSDLEALLLTHPKVLDAAVIGIPDERAGQLPKAFVVSKSGNTINPEEIQKWIHDKVAPYKRPRGGVEVVQTIPKSPSGKILRRTLMDMEKERAAKASGKAKL